MPKVVVVEQALQSQLVPCGIVFCGGGFSVLLPQTWCFVFTNQIHNKLKDIMVDGGFPF